MSIDQRVLERVRGLLAKAESTTFPHEAEALTTKAQELMARHSIDLAMVHSPESGEPVRRVIDLDRPYVSAKALLLTEVAEANRCRAAWDSHAEVGSVVGHEADVDATELLFTSLLVQAGVAMVAEGSKRGVDGQSRTRAFRKAFLVGFAVRIGERLVEATRHAEAEGEAEYGDALLPVLAARGEEVELAFEREFPRLRTSRITARDPQGWRAGTEAADHARLTPPGEIDERRSA